MLTSPSFSDPNQPVLRSTTSINSNCFNSSHHVLHSIYILATYPLPTPAYAEPRCHLPANAFNDCRKPSSSSTYTCGSASTYSHCPDPRTCSPSTRETHPRADPEPAAPTKQHHSTATTSRPNSRRTTTPAPLPFRIPTRQRSPRHQPLPPPRAQLPPEQARVTRRTPEKRPSESAPTHPEPAVVSALCGLHAASAVQPRLPG